MPRLYDPAPTASTYSAGYMSANDKNTLDTLSTKFPVSILDGGTGATTAADALTNLGALSTTGTAAKATKLATAREIYVALGSTRNTDSKVTFDGSADKAIHVSGTLPIARGGTGAASAADALTNLGALSTTGTAAAATKLATARSLYVALGTAYDSSNPVTFNGTAAKALPVNGTLGISNGGSGCTAVLVPATVTTNGISVDVFKWGKVVFLHLYGTLSAAKAAGDTIVTAPSGYRPKSECDFVCAHKTWATSGVVWLYISTGGAIACKTAIDAGGLYGNCCYVIP